MFASRTGKVKVTKRNSLRTPFIKTKTCQFDCIHSQSAVFIREQLRNGSWCWCSSILVRGYRMLSTEIFEL